jgi:hypothetical protein
MATTELVLNFQNWATYVNLNKAGNKCCDVSQEWNLFTKITESEIENLDRIFKKYSYSNKF